MQKVVFYILNSDPCNADWTIVGTISNILIFRSLFMLINFHLGKKGG